MFANLWAYSFLPKTKLLTWGKCQIASFSSPAGNYVSYPSTQLVVASVSAVLPNFGAIGRTSTSHISDGFCNPFLQFNYEPNFIFAFLSAQRRSHWSYMSTGMNIIVCVMFYVTDFGLPILTLILLNKLCLPHSFLIVNQSDNSMLFVHMNSQTKWMKFIGSRKD